ncbi:MAG: HAD family hydrolase [Huintestinicola sp.]
MIKNVIFDIGLVLIDFDWADFVHGIVNDEKAEKVINAATWGNKTWNELDRGVLPFDEVIKLFQKNATGYEKEIKLLFDRLGECPRRKPYAIPWIKELKAKGCGVYYLSNFFEYLMQEAPDVLDFIPYMDGGIFSCHEKITKPDPEIYRRLCAKYDLIPSECVFIDDSPANIESARKFGLNAVLFEGYEKAYSEVMGMIE